MTGPGAGMRRDHAQTSLGRQDVPTLARFLPASGSTLQQSHVCPLQCWQRGAPRKGRGSGKYTSVNHSRHTQEMYAGGVGGPLSGKAPLVNFPALFVHGQHVVPLSSVDFCPAIKYGWMGHGGPNLP